MNITIRPAIPGDEEAVVSLLLAQFADHRILTGRDLLYPAVVTALQDDTLGFIYLAVDESQAVGIAVVSFSWTLENGGLTSYLDELYIQEEYRGQGIGSQLVETVIARARQAGCLAVDLEVDIEHKRVEALYQRFGFRYLPRSRWTLAL